VLLAATGRATSPEGAVGRSPANRSSPRFDTCSCFICRRVVLLTPVNVAMANAIGRLLSGYGSSLPLWDMARDFMNFTMTPFYTLIHRCCDPG
jgi:hypothetical protein